MTTPDSKSTVEERAKVLVMGLSACACGYCDHNETALAALRRERRLAFDTAIEAVETIRGQRFHVEGKITARECVETLTRLRDSEDPNA